MDKMILAGIAKEQAIEICKEIVECYNKHYELQERICCFCGRSGDIWYSQDWCSTCQEEYCEGCTAWEHNIGERTCHNKFNTKYCEICAFKVQKTTFDKSFVNTKTRENSEE